MNRRKLVRMAFILGEITGMLLFFITIAGVMIGVVFVFTFILGAIG